MWISIVVLGYSSADSNPVITCQIRDFERSERATEPTRDLLLHRGVQEGPLRAPQKKALEKTRDGRRRTAYVQFSKKSYFLPYIVIYTRSTSYHFTTLLLAGIHAGQQLYFLKYICFPSRTRSSGMACMSYARASIRSTSKAHVLLQVWGALASFTALLPRYHSLY